jgi:hypothetical protein
VPLAQRSGSTAWLLACVEVERERGGEVAGMG